MAVGRSQVALRVKFPHWGPPARKHVEPGLPGALRRTAEPLGTLEWANRPTGGPRLVAAGRLLEGGCGSMAAWQSQFLLLCIFVPVLRKSAPYGFRGNLHLAGDWTPTRTEVGSWTKKKKAVSWRASGVVDGRKPLPDFHQTWVLVLLCASNLLGMPSQWWHTITPPSFVLPQVPCQIASFVLSD